jgi:sigma-E factor negative regulatory protein RseC
MFRMSYNREEVSRLEHLIRETGNIIRIDGEMAEVMVERHASCESCGACGLGGKPQISFMVRNPIGARKGDRVEVELQIWKLYQAAFLMYTLPLMMLFVGYYGLRYIGTKFGLAPVCAENTGIGGGFLLMALAYWMIRLADRKSRIGHRFQPKLVAVVTPEEPASEE